MRNKYSTEAVEDVYLQDWKSILTSYDHHKAQFFHKQDLLQQRQKKANFSLLMQSLSSNEWAIVCSKDYFYIAW